MNGLRTYLRLRTRPRWIGESDVHVGDAAVLVFCVIAALVLIVTGGPR